MAGGRVGPCAVGLSAQLCSVVSSVVMLCHLQFCWGCWVGKGLPSWRPNGKQSGCCAQSFSITNTGPQTRLVCVLITCLAACLLLPYTQALRDHVA
jgi:hypothetical protein